MAISKKGSRNIIVSGYPFKWRATGNDGWITIIIWPENNDSSRVVTSVGYHHDLQEVSEGHFSSKSQLVVTNRMIRAVILHIGIERILENKGQMNIGPIESFYDITHSVRSK